MEAPRANRYDPPRSDRGGYDLKKLKGRHRLILRMHARGIPNRKISQVLGVGETMVSQTINSPLGKEQLKRIYGAANENLAEVISEFEDLAPIAVAVNEEIMLGAAEKASDRLRASENILNGAGYGKRTQVDVTHRISSAEELQEARRRSLGMMEPAGLLPVDSGDPEPEYTDVEILDDTDDTG